MKVTDLIGLAEDFQRHQTHLVNALAEITRCAQGIRTYYREIFLPAHEAAKQDPQVRWHSGVMAEFEQLKAVLEDAADFDEIDNLQRSYEAVAALDILAFEHYTLRVDMFERQARADYAAALEEKERLIRRRDEEADPQAREAIQQSIQHIDAQITA